MQTEHLTDDGKFQSDKFPTTPAGLVPLATSDPMAQDILLRYALRRAEIDEQFSNDVVRALANDGYGPAIDLVEGWGALPADRDPEQLDLEAGR